MYGDKVLTTIKKTFSTAAAGGGGPGSVGVPTTAVGVTVGSSGEVASGVGSVGVTVGKAKYKGDFEKQWREHNGTSKIPEALRDVHLVHPAAQFNRSADSFKRSKSVATSTTTHITKDLSDSKAEDNAPRCKRETISSDLRLDKFQMMLSMPNLKMEELKKLCWNGIPPEFRAECWKLLLGYTPLARERWESTITAKRQSYWSCVPTTLDEKSVSTLTEYEISIYHQIHIDVLRTNRSVPLFQLPEVQKALERILYLWAIRHPASSYVQGINDLVTPFYAVFLQPHIREPIETVKDISNVGEENLRDIEADCYWCLTKFIDSIQDNYTFAQPGIQKMIFKLKEVINKIDAPLNIHLAKQKLEYIQFSFRWMNCLLMRELPLKLVIRTWDTYLSEDDTFATLHIYLCAAFLVKWSEPIRHYEFQEMMIFIQNLPTKDWTEKDLDALLAQAYVWKTLYNDSIGHLKSNNRKV